MSRHQIHVVTSHTIAHVVTSNPCRDTVSTHSGISRSRHQKPGRDLPHCYPCRDLNSAQPHFCYVATPFFHVATSLVAAHVATSIPTGQNPRSSILKPTATQPGRDATSWSRPHVKPNQVATSNPCRDLNRS